MATERKWNYDGLARNGSPTEAEIAQIEAEKARIRAENALPQTRKRYRPHHKGPQGPRKGRKPAQNTD